VTEQQRPPTEEELRAAYEAELQRIRVDDVLIQTVVSLINLGGLRAGLVPGSEAERDLDQLRQAIEAIRSRLQLEYSQAVAGPAAEPEGAPEPPPGEGGPAAQEPPGAEGGEGPAQRSGRLWIPGQ
jgi:hypothetical protein